MKQGEVCEVRTEGGRDWIKGQIELASENGKSLAVLLERPLWISEGFGLLIGGDGIAHAAVLLLRENQRWIDIQTGMVCEVRQGETAS